MNSQAKLVGPLLAIFCLSIAACTQTSEDKRPLRVLTQDLLVHSVTVEKIESSANGTQNVYAPDQQGYFEMNDEKFKLVITGDNATHARPAHLRVLVQLPSHNVSRCFVIVRETAARLRVGKEFSSPNAEQFQGCQNDSDVALLEASAGVRPKFSSQILGLFEDKILEIKGEEGEATIKVGDFTFKGKIKPQKTIALASNLSGGSQKIVIGSTPTNRPIEQTENSEALCLLDPTKGLFVSGSRNKDTWFPSLFFENVRVVSEELNVQVKTDTENIRSIVGGNRFGVPKDFNYDSAECTANLTVPQTEDSHLRVNMQCQGVSWDDRIVEIGLTVNCSYISKGKLTL